jgi:hypothetical protein
MDFGKNRRITSYVDAKEALEMLSPYRTEHINRFGNYTLNLEKRKAAETSTTSRKARCGKPRRNPRNVARRR